MSLRSCLSPFYVILYKNYILRKRHWLLTIFELAIPIIFFLLVAFTRSKIPTLSKIYINDTSNGASVSDEIIYTRLNIHGMQLLFVPETNFTSKLIRKVQLKLQLYNEGIHGFQTELDFLKYYNKHGSNGTTAVVFFNDMKNSIPKKLSYDIKMYEKHVIWNTKQVFIETDMYIHGIGSETYLDKGFIPIQLALDTSFIELVSEKEFQITVNFQEFPYPPHFQDNGIDNLFLHILPFFTVFSFIFLCPSILKRIVEEKSSGMKELMKMYGLNSGMMWSGWFINGFIVCFISVIGIVILLKVNFWGVEYAPIEHCNGFVLLIFLSLYCSASISFLFLFSTIFNKPTLAMVTGIWFWIISYIVFSSVANNVEYMPWIIKCCLLIMPNFSLFYGYKAISVFELRNMKLTLSNIWESPTGSSEDITMGLVINMLLFETVFFFLITVYLDNIFPGVYGISKPWYFPLKYITRNKNKVSESNMESSEPSEVIPLVEKSELPKKIQIRNLKKRYGNKLAVNGINLDINEHQITGLLGHNGAGKTTTMSILTGMINATSGSIYVDGYNLQENFDEIRHQIAFCPQHNLLFPDLTVSEHLIIFGMLKGLSRKDAKIQANKLLKMKLKLFDKRNEFINKLSGGMKRKVSLGIALIGDTQVIILDEPTAGIDIEGRRGLWDLILSYKNSKTILISTHFMEEADVLSDRLAILDNGYLLTYATPLYLKKIYDIGYHLIIDYNTNKEGIEDIVRLLPEGTEPKDKNLQSIKYILPNNKKSEFATLFMNLTEQKAKNRISSFSIINTTLEDVYLRVIGGVTSSKHKNESSETKSFKNQKEGDVTVIDGIGNVHQSTVKKPTYKNKFYALIKKRLLYFKRKWLSYLSMPLIMLCLTILVPSLGGDSVLETTNDGKKLDLNLEAYGETNVYYSINGDNILLSTYFDNIVNAQHSKPYKVDNVSETIANKGIENIAFYRQHMVVAAEFNTIFSQIDNVNVMYSNNALHGAPISLNIVMNAIAKLILGKDYSISASNTPLHSVNNKEEYIEQSSATSLFIWLTLFPLGPLLIMSNVILFSYTENATMVKLLQNICGVGSLCLLVNYAIDFLYSFICMVLCTVLCLIPFAYIFETGTLIVILLIYASTSVPIVYVFSYSKTVGSGYTRFLLSNICIVPILTLIVLVMELSTDDYYEQISKILLHLFAISPQFTLNYMVAKYSIKMVSNYNWKIKSVAAKHSICAYEPNPCCFDEEACKNYESFFKSADFSYVWVTVSTAIVVMIILSLNELKDKKQKIIGYFSSKGSSEETSETGGSFENSSNVLNVYNLKKSYLSIKSLKLKEIIKGISFNVRKSECFGILGINGAGKSTTFRLLAEQECFSQGKIVKRTSEVFKEHYMGYCPQQDALIEEFTGRELLEMFGKLRGLTDAEYEAEKMLKKFGLKNYANQCCGTYSGGNKRKLNTCLSMIGLPLLILLDEPTTGVDPVSRRKLWDVIATIKKEESSGIILTSHSMDECETLCDRLMIMKDGKIVYIGTISDLRKNHCSGFVIKLKLKRGKDASNIKVDLFKNFQNENTEIIEDHVKEEYGGLIHVHVQKTTWSEVFEIMENISEKYDSIEDYCVSETSLENLFLKFARQ